MDGKRRAVTEKHGNSDETSWRCLGVCTHSLNSPFPCPILNRQLVWISIRIMGDSRWTRVGRHPYNTRSHRARPIRTPGGKLVAQTIKKKSSGVKCSDCKTVLPGIKHYRKLKNVKKRERTVSRAYGGSCCAGCVKQRIVRAFLLEEQKAVKKVLAERSAGKK